MGPSESTKYGFVNWSKDPVVSFILRYQKHIAKKHVLLHMYHGWGVFNPFEGYPEHSMFCVLVTEEGRR